MIKCVLIRLALTVVAVIKDTACWIMESHVKILMSARAEMGENFVQYQTHNVLTNQEVMLVNAKMATRSHRMEHVKVVNNIRSVIL